MRTTLLTLAVLVALDSDLAVLLWLAALAPLFVALTFVGFLLGARSRPKPVVWREAERHLSERPPKWRPAHRIGTPRQVPGRHEHARGSRLAGVSRQVQLEELTTEMPRVAALPHEHEPYRDGAHIRCRHCAMDLPRPAGMPEVGAAGMQTWD